MSREFYKKHRPKQVEDMLGQPMAVDMLQKYQKYPKKIPHTILFHGPAGCGKTTGCRILTGILGVTKDSGNLTELNCADFRGIDSVRDIRGSAELTSLGGGNKVWILDEFHQMTSEAQNGFLKLMEDTPEHVYFLLASSNPDKIIKALRTRCTKIPIVPLDRAAMSKVLKRVWKAEGEGKLPDEVVEKIVDAAEGSAREALVILEQIGHLKPSKMAEAVVKGSTKTASIQIARTLLNPRVSWKDIAAILKEHQDEDAEGLRWMVMGYCRAILLNGATNFRAAAVLDFFRDNFFDSKWNGMVSACFQVFENTKGNK